MRSASEGDDRRDPHAPHASLPSWRREHSSRQLAEYGERSRQSPEMFKTDAPGERADLNSREDRLRRN
jgi:hypothetical protein